MHAQLLIFSINCLKQQLMWLTVKVMLFTWIFPCGDI